MEGNIFDLNNQTEKPRTEMKMLLRNLLLGSLGFLMGRAGFAGLFPLSLVYWTILSETNRNVMLMVTVTTGAGLLWQGNIFNLHYLLAGFAGYAIFRLFKRHNRFNSLPCWIALVFLGAGLLINYYRQGQIYQYLLIGGEAILIYILINLGRGGMKELINRKQKLTGQALITIFLLSSGAVVGLANLEIVSRLWLIVPLFLIVIGVARHLGLVYSITGAVFFGMVLLTAGVVHLVTMAKFIVLAVSCGLFQQRQRYWMIPGVMLAFFIYSGFSPTVQDLQETVIEFSAAGILYLLIPESIWFYLFAGLRRENGGVDQLEISQEMAGSMSHYLQELAGVFQELSATFREVIPEEGEDKFSDFKYLFHGRLCRHCPRVRICWHQERKKTLRLLKLLISSGEEQGVINPEKIEKYLGKHCIYFDKINDPVKTIFELYQVNSFWRERLSDKQQIVSEQLAGVGEMLEQFSDSSRLAFRSSTSLERIRARALDREIELQAVEIDSKINTSKVNLEIVMEPCTGNRPCEEQLLTLLNQEYEWDYRILERECGDKLKDRPCRLLYGPRGNFQLDLAVIQEPADGVSGDSFLHHPLRDGEDLIVLSDGMGTGKKAARESKAAINLLSSILDAGFDQQLAIKTINSALYLRNQEENFTTLDLALFDTFTGRVIFSKIGAVSSYIKRDWELTEVESSSLPVGILSKVETSTTQFQLKDGDFVVMLTDGVIDAGRENQAQDGEELLKQLIRNSSFGQARDLAEYIREVMLVDQQNIRDDFTVVVFLVEEFLPKRRKFKV